MEASSGPRADELRLLGPPRLPKRDGQSPSSCDLSSSPHELKLTLTVTAADPDHVREDKWKVVTRKRAEFLIKRRESTQSYDRPGNPVKQCDTSALQANERMEDRSAEKILAGPDGE